MICLSESKNHIVYIVVTNYHMDRLQVANYHIDFQIIREKNDKYI
jgi:hypothetical protein